MVNDFEVELELDEFLKSLANDARDFLERNSPQNKGTYAKSWKVKKVKSGYVVYNKDRASLTHLLEKGHLSKNMGWVMAQMHVLAAEQEIERNISSKAKLIKVIAK